ncbi:MAG: hypothetical protein ACREJG_02795 [Candidatus Rokuibacteriota bacterium]
MRLRRPAVCLLSLVFLLVLASPHPVVSEEESWDLDTMIEVDGTTSSILQDSAGAKLPIKFKCPALKKKRVALNLPKNAAALFGEHAVDQGCVCAVIDCTVF